MMLEKVNDNDCRKQTINHEATQPLGCRKQTIKHQQARKGRNSNGG